MTAKAAICKALLLGKTISVKNSYSWFGVSNCSREVIRLVEKPFGVKCLRKEMNGVSRFLRPCRWIDYRLKVQGNEEGIGKMIEYLFKQEGDPKTEEQARDRKKIQGILNFVKQKA